MICNALHDVRCASVNILGMQYNLLIAKSNGFIN